MYRYEALNSPSSSFTVLTLHPGRRDDTVRCYLSMVLLEDVERENGGEYEALYYTWGDLADVDTILCHDQDLGISSNLRHALIQFRSETEDLLLFADAICIDQVRADQLLDCAMQ